MKITPRSQAITKTRDDKTKISYYIFDEYEVHHGELPPGVVQPWHHHSQISETLYITEGSLLFHFLDNQGKKQTQKVTVGDMIEVEDTPHTFSNPFDETCTMIAFRFVPDGTNKHNLIKNDKVLHPDLDT